jgi:hypothetical protein
VVRQGGPDQESVPPPYWTQLYKQRKLLLSRNLQNVLKQGQNQSKLRDGKDTVIYNFDLHPWNTMNGARIFFPPIARAHTSC